MKDSHRGMDSAWQQRIFPKNGTSVLLDDRPDGCFKGSSYNRVLFSAFINSMDDASISYLSLAREYACRPLQGKTLVYEGLYKALIS